MKSLKDGATRSMTSLNYNFYGFNCLLIFHISDKVIPGNIENYCLLFILSNEGEMRSDKNKT